MKYVRRKPPAHCLDWVESWHEIDKNQLTRRWITIYTDHAEAGNHAARQLYPSDQFFGTVSKQAFDAMHSLYANIKYKNIK